MPRHPKKKKKESHIASSIPGSPSPSSPKSLSSSTSFITDSIPSIFLGKGKSLIVQRAIASGARHGIELVPGRANPAMGNCAFEAPIFNINDRSCFMEHLPMSINYYRRIWITDMENRLFNSPFNTGYTQSQWHAEWQKLKEDNVYEVDYFGDLVLPAISCGLKKVLLIFNTNINFPRDPISVINPTDYNVESDSNVPIVLAYNMSHYESIHPVNQTAIERSIELVNTYILGNYRFTHQDLESVVCLQDVPKIQENSEDNQMKVTRARKVRKEVTVNRKKEEQRQPKKNV